MADTNRSPNEDPEMIGMAGVVPPPRMNKRIDVLNQTMQVIYEKVKVLWDHEDILAKKKAILDEKTKLLFEHEDILAKKDALLDKKLDTLSKMLDSMS